MTTLTKQFDKTSKPDPEPTRMHTATEHRSAKRTGNPAEVQHAAGNLAVQRLFQSNTHTKLSVSQPGDAHEQEADRLADQVVASSSPPHALDKARSIPAASPRRFLHNLGQGLPLDASSRAFMEARFGCGLGHVRVHTDAQAIESARLMNARAFTLGQDIVFGRGQYAPGTFSGKKLLAHELAHVVQQHGKVANVLHRQIADTTTPTSALQPAPGPDAQTSSLPTEAEPMIILRDDGPQPGPDQMNETEFMTQLHIALNSTSVPLSSTSQQDEKPLGDLFVPWLEQLSLLTGRSIESLVQEIVQVTALTAQDYLNLLVQEVPHAAIQVQLALQAMLPHPQMLEIDLQLPPQILGPVQTPDAGVPATAWPTPAFSSPEDVRKEHPEITPTLAGILAPWLPSQWGMLSAMLQGTIFHALISAGYVFGYPPMAHPAALVNRSGGGLGRRRTDLRNPMTYAVIEIKPEGDTDGASQLAAYVTTLRASDNPLWHEATGLEPTEDWAPPSSPARYELDLLAIKFILEAHNEYATEPGILYYKLDLKPGIPVPIYVPRWYRLPNRKFNFDFPPGLQPVPVPVPVGPPLPVPTSPVNEDEPWSFPQPPELSPQQKQQVVVETGMLATFGAFLLANWYWGPLIIL